MPNESETDGSIFDDLDLIHSMLEWHADMEADIENPSPEDMHAHCNGIALQALFRIRSRLSSAEKD